MSEPSDPPNLDAYLRKQKPRNLLTSSQIPAHTVTPAPRAIVHAAPIPHPDPYIPPVPAAPSIPTPTPKPRKRFRKKVNGLFGDQTDLKKRMSKLLRNADPTNLLVALGNDMEPPPRPPPSLPIADGLLETLPAFPKAPPPTAQDFDLPAFVDTARRLLGSPERLQTVRRTMGRLSPRSNDRFLTELELGTPPSPPVRDGGLTPPPLPSVGSSEPDSSPVAMERTGAPAVLRRKARRLDRGYRCADVLRARLGDSPGRPRQARVERTETEDEEVGGLERPLLTSDPFQMLVEVAAVERKQTAMGKGSGESGKRRMSEGGRRRKRRKTKGSNA